MTEILKADGTPYEEAVSYLERQALQSVANLLKKHCEPSKFAEDMKLQELRKSCGGESKPGVITFRRYGSLRQIEDPEEVML